jgi:hypothetical protein
MILLTDKGFRTDIDRLLRLIEKNGNVLKKGDAGFGGVSVQAVSTEKAVVVTDNSLISVALTAIK